MEVVEDDNHTDDGTPLLLLLGLLLPRLAICGAPIVASSQYGLHRFSLLQKVHAIFVFAIDHSRVSLVLRDQHFWPNFVARGRPYKDHIAVQVWILPGNIPIVGKWLHVLVSDLFDTTCGHLGSLGARKSRVRFKETL